MELERGPWDRINKILTFAAALFLVVWLLRWLGSGARYGGDFVLTWRTLLSLGVIVTCCGYLLWRFMTWFFWNKYFK